MMGVDSFDAIINAPQAGILALGRVRTVPEWRDGGGEPPRVISATLSVDHRVAAGAAGGPFLGALQGKLPGWGLLLLKRAPDAPVPGTKGCPGRAPGPPAPHEAP